MVNLIKRLHASVVLLNSEDPCIMYFVAHKGRIKKIMLGLL